jgi:hypothetical protein
MVLDSAGIRQSHVQKARKGWAIARLNQDVPCIPLSTRTGEQLRPPQNSQDSGMNFDVARRANAVFIHRAKG